MCTRQLLFYVGVLFLTCCSRMNNSVLADVESLIANEQYDSAYSIVSSIDGQSLDSEGAKALFNLLLTQTSYQTYHTPPPDSLIDYSIDYFKETGDKRRLADSYYYKAAGLFERGGTHKAILLAKKAEETATEVGDISQLYKIAAWLCNTNKQFGNHILQLEQAQRSLKYAQASGKRKWLAYSYYRVGMAFLDLEEADSTKHYIEMTDTLLDAVDSNDIPYFLGSLGYIYKDSDPKRAEGYLDRSLALLPLTHTYENLADICLDEGNEDKAYELWQRALMLDDGAPKGNVLYNILEYDFD